MTTRPTQVAGAFYPSSGSICERELATFLDDAETSSGEDRVLGGIVPHAGWAYSGPTAGQTFGNLGPAFETAIIFGAVHVPGVRQASVWPDGTWDTPLGPIEIDHEMAAELLATGVVEDNPTAHIGEHAIEVELPFLKLCYPNARLLPIAVPSDDRGMEVGRRCAEVARQLGRRCVALGSTDLTHYGPRFGFDTHGVGEPAHRWVMEENDPRIISVMEGLEADRAVDVAREFRNACGAGAIAATLEYVKAFGARPGELLGHTSSYEVRPSAGKQDFVCYSSLLFRAAK